MSSDCDGILFGGPVTESLENAKSLGEFCLNRLRRHGESVLYINGDTSEKVTASQLLLGSIRVAECLLNHGVQAGDSVAICCENRFEVPYVMFAVFYIGATYVPLNPTYTERELLHTCSFSHPKFIFASHQTIKKVKQVVDQTKSTQRVFVFGHKIVGSNFESFDTFVQNKLVPTNVDFVCPPQNMRENIALVFCSSGTSGSPKGVEVTQYNVWFAISGGIINGESDECFLSVAPWTHIFGCYSLTRTAIEKRLTVYLTKFEEDKFLKCIETFKVTVLLVVPPIMVLLSKTSLLDKYDTSSIKYAASTAAPLNKETVEAVQKRLPQLKIRQFYGMSEGGTFCTQTDNLCKPGSVGGLRTGVYGKVIDTETGKVLGANSPGELLFKSDGIMKGYVGDSDATKASFDPDGWLHTGDVGFYDNDGEFFIVDRLKELIKYKGFQVPPAELEALILTHPNVKDVGVIGVPDEAAGELPLAFVVKQGDCTEADIMDFVASRTSAPKRLRGGVKFIAEIPKNPSGKILRRVLRDLIKNQKSKL